MLDEEEIVGIFVESSENIGLLYNSYEPILGVSEKFMQKVALAVKDLTGKPDKVDIDLGDEISKYKQDVSRKFTASAIQLGQIGQWVKKIKAFQGQLNKFLGDFTKLKDKISFGGNYGRAIIHKPKVYSKNVDEATYSRINANIRNVNRAMDWIEKIMIDLFNMADQDLNILTIVSRVYAKQHIYEALPNAVVVTEDLASRAAGMLHTLTNPLDINIKPAGNTVDKKTGTAANYITRNHDMASYGEDDPEEKRNDQKDMEDYRRPSAGDSDSSSSTPPSDDAEKNDEEDSGSNLGKNGMTPSGVNNYYYYTYQNSLNKNTGSFNRDNSQHDDHSTHNINRSVHDDHSHGKRVGSHDTTIHGSTSQQDGHSSEEDREDHSFRAVESVDPPWKLQLPPLNG